MTKSMKYRLIVFICYFYPHPLPSDIDTSKGDQSPMYFQRTKNRSQIVTHQQNQKIKVYKKI